MPVNSIGERLQQAKVYLDTPELFAWTVVIVCLSVGVEKLMAACRRYFQTTGRRISYEYAMIDGVNDSDWQADLLARLLKGTPGHVNLIPLNDVEESPLKPSRRVAAFQRRLEGHGVTVTVRRKLGGDIDASCGQLRRKAMAQTLGRNDGRKEADIP